MIYTNSHTLTQIYIIKKNNNYSYNIKYFHFPHKNIENMSKVS